MSTLSKQDNEILNLKCDGCGTDIQIKFGSWRRNKNGPHLCRKCRGKAEHERINNLTPEERAAYLEKKNKAISKGWSKQNDEMKKKVSDMRKSEWQNEERRKKHHDMLIDRWANISDEEKDVKIQDLLEGQAKYWSDESNKAYHSNRARNKWFKQPIEEQQRILKALEAGRIKYYENATEEELKAMRKKQGESNKKYWANLPKDERNKRLEYLYNRANLPSKNELAFIERINSLAYSFESQYKNKIKHPDFDKVFTLNTATGSTNISPYHSWDFIIHLSQSDILIDIDGSVHDPKNKTTGITEFNDSKRPYQTDGLPAYAVLCYDDNLTDNTPVINVTTNEKMSFKQFLYYLYAMNMSDKELKQLIKDSKK